MTIFDLEEMMSKFCSQCGRRLAENDKFCSECGTPIKTTVSENAEPDLLVDQPQFADKCDWNKLNSEHWSLLIGEQPQFAEKAAQNLH